MLRAALEILIMTMVMVMMMMVMVRMQVITNKYLEIRTLDFGSFIYNITTAPVHGWISVLAPNKVKEFKKSDIFVLHLR